MSDPESSFDISPTSRLNLPLALLFSVLALTALGAVAWSSAKERTERNATDIVELKSEAKIQREILIRIDENVKELRRKPPGN